MLLTLKTLCRRLEIDEPTALRFTEQGVLPPPAVLGGRVIRWSTAVVERWAAAGCPSCTPPSERDFIDWRVFLATEAAERELAAGLVRTPEKIARDEAGRLEREAAESERLDREAAEDWRDYDAVHGRPD
ncbi:MAG: hypothetical protein GX621_16575 [Pirellulaceae bacterium]|nr:hypothetical protein [Pirellulaceae bacterium]